MARLILHIGAHKTATTFLQRCFFLNRNLLEQHGVYYPDIGPNPAHHILTTPWIDNNEIPPTFYGTAGPDGVWERLIADYASRAGTVFLSGEPFSRLQPQRVDMAALAARLSPFEDVRIIYTARRQTELIQAIWLQKMKAKLAGELGEFLNHACTRFLATGVPVEHGLIYDHVLTGFSPRQVTILDYDHIRHAPGGVLQTFLDLIGVGLKAEQMSRVGARGANISPDPLGMYVYSRIAPNERPDKGELARIVAALKELHSARSTIYSREDYARICRVFAPLNYRFEARVRVHQPDFAMAPEQAEPTFTWRDDLSISDWSRVAAAANPGRPGKSWSVS